VKGPHIVIESESTAAGRHAARLVDEAIRTRAGIVLALPTGASPVPMYAELVRLHRESGTDWRGVSTFNLDEYVAVGPEHPISYAHFMAAHLFDHVNLPPDRRHLPDGLAPDPEAETVRYEAAIEAAGGIDLAVLGVGVNGHLGFNEPGPALTARTHVAELLPETWRRNFPDLAAELGQAGHPNAPYRRAFTMGIGTILQSRAIVLLATGETKRSIIREALHGPVTTHIPASLLQLHRQVTVVLDRKAAAD
jgi:glucosamine-6-phosphate deaminase